MDETLLLWINQGWAHPTLDVFFYWLSQRLIFAVPFSLLLLTLCIWRWRLTGLWLWLTLVLMVGSSDILGNQLKHVFKQPRPCYTLASQIRQIGPPQDISCGANLTGMPSNHAINFFAAASFLTVVLGRRAAWMYAVAILVGLSRIYLGKHYPSQVLVGAILGMLWGTFLAWLGLKYLPFLERWRGIPHD